MLKLPGRTLADWTSEAGDVDESLARWAAAGWVPEHRWDGTPVTTRWPPDDPVGDDPGSARRNAPCRDGPRRLTHHCRRRQTSRCGPGRGHSVDPSRQATGPPGAGPVWVDPTSVDGPSRGFLSRGTWRLHAKTHAMASHISGAGRSRPDRGYTTPRNVTWSAPCYRPSILDLRVEWVMSGHVCPYGHRRGIRKGSARKVNIYNRAPGAGRRTRALMRIPHEFPTRRPSANGFRRSEAVYFSGRYWV